MKKNTMMRLASALLVVVLLTTCAISGTFAKYTTTDNGTDTARVAKWGVTIEAENNTLFTTDYATTNTGKYTGQYSVSSAADDRDDVLAPGTSGTITSIAIDGTPEVAVEVIVAATVALSDNWMVGTDFYCPVVVTVGTTAIDGLDYDSAAAFAAAIKAAIDGYSAVYGPNTDLSAITDDTAFDISWAWAFEGADGSDQTDVKDTALGDAAVNADLTIDIALAITINQVD